jgi:hypothetical protein
MPGRQPNIVKLYRIIHIDNIEYLLTHGIYCSAHSGSDPNYINIGDSELITKRTMYPVGINPPGGMLGEYIPFYFGRLSPMLLNIKTGYRGITKRPQSDIIYVVCRIDDIRLHCGSWCFTDGHAKTRITTFYNSLADLSEVHWDKVDLRQWKNTQNDFDRMRCKQAEFLIRSHVPVACISEIVAYDYNAASIVQEITNKLNLNIPVQVNPEGAYYY